MRRPESKPGYVNGICSEPVSSKIDAAIAGSRSWLGKPLSIQIDHRNGIRSDHRLENLRMLCPNCHSQTETYGAKNRKIRPLSSAGAEGLATLLSNIRSMDKRAYDWSDIQFYYDAGRSRTRSAPPSKSHRLRIREQCGKAG